MGGRGADYQSPTKKAASEQRKRDKETGIAAEITSETESAGFIDNTPAPPPEPAKSPAEQRVDAFYQSWNSRVDEISDEADKAIGRAYTIGNTLKVGQDAIGFIIVNNTKVQISVKKLSKDEKKKNNTNHKFRIKVGDSEPYYASTAYQVRSGGGMDAFVEAEREGVYRARYGN